MSNGIDRLLPPPRPQRTIAEIRRLMLQPDAPVIATIVPARRTKKRTRKTA